ncbi:unnamed protein product [marine sediment metagenome]|uniref:Uncharacterized protein n=1 Tax=marine sediment metagenome TaxID=412755 RepID=X1NHB3_9ZZZZ
MSESERIFCPLKSSIFRLIKYRRASWAFVGAKTSTARRLTHHRDDLPADIEFRKGMRGKSVWGRADKFIEFSNPFEIPKRILGESCATLDSLQTRFDHSPLIGIHFKLTGVRS